MSRYTPKMLDDDIESFNAELKRHGILKRFEHGGRNGYQTVDEYSVDANGIRIGTGVDSMVGAGTSRECLGCVRQRFSDLRVSHFFDLERKS